MPRAVSPTSAPTLYLSPLPAKALLLHIRAATMLRDGGLHSARRLWPVKRPWFYRLGPRTNRVMWQTQFLGRFQCSRWDTVALISVLLCPASVLEVFVSKQSRPIREDNFSRCSDLHENF